MVTGDAFAGRWLNVDADTDGWVRIDIWTDGTAWSVRKWADFNVQAEVIWREEVVRYAGDEDHMPGPFVPPPAARLHLGADSVCDTEMKYGFASWDPGFADEHMLLRLEGDLLITDEFTVFKDCSGRSNYRTQYRFKKLPDPPVADACRLAGVCDTMM